MSLCCFECGQDIRPGKVFPDREGGMLYVNLQTSIWGSDVNTWHKVFVEASVRFATCFDCLLGVCTDSDHETALRRVFATYNAEADFRSLEKRLGDATSSYQELVDTWKSQYKILKKLWVSIPQDRCLCCGHLFVDEQSPHFTFKVMDRAAIKGNTSFFGSYTLSSIQTGTTSFRICFICMSTKLPRLFEGFSSYLLGLQLKLPEVAGGNKITVLTDPSEEQEKLLKRLFPPSR